MKKKVVIIGIVLVLVVYFLSAFRISFSDYKFIADFNSGLSSFEYAPLNPKLERRFTYESSQPVDFKAHYSYNKIVYNVNNPSEDFTAEKKAFEDIYDLYYNSFMDYHNHTNIGEVWTDEEKNIKRIHIGISGYKYSVTFDFTDSPSIIYEKIAVA